MDIIEKIQKNIKEHVNWNKVLEIASESKYNSKLGEVFDYERGEMIGNLLGYPVLGCGAHRVTLEVKGFAVKIPIESVGFGDNAQEIVIWSRSPEDTKKYLTPFIGGSEEVAIFEKATLIEYEDFLKLEEETDKIISIIQKSGIDVFDLDSDRYDQWGFIQGELRVLDYGEFSIK